MGIGQRSVSRTRRDQRRSHHKAKKPTLVECSNCHQMKPAHIACPSCGFYKGRQVMIPREA